MPDHARDAEAAELCAAWMAREGLEVWVPLSALRQHVRHWTAREGLALSANRVNAIMREMLRPLFAQATQ